MRLIKIHLARLLFFPSFLCLDAPLVALGWTICLSRDLDGIGQKGFSPVTGAALFLSIWLIYLFDRLLDVARCGADAALTRRHAWAYRHRSLLGALFIGAFVFFLISVLPQLDGKILVGGFIMALFTGLYYLAFRFSCAYRRMQGNVPFKEMIISVCFVAAIILAASPEDLLNPPLFLIAGYFSAFTANCLVISRAERGIDRLADPAAYFSGESSATPHDSLPDRMAMLAVTGGLATLLLEGEWFRSSLSLVLCGLLTRWIAGREREDDGATQMLADGIQTLPWAVLAGEALGTRLFS